MKKSSIKEILPQKVQATTAPERNTYFILSINKAKIPKKENHLINMPEPQQ
jgi:hypothetical protein